MLKLDDVICRSVSVILSPTIYSRSEGKLMIFTTLKSALSNIENVKKLIEKAEKIGINDDTGHLTSRNDVIYVSGYIHTKRVVCENIDLTEYLIESGKFGRVDFEVYKGYKLGFRIIYYLGDTIIKHPEVIKEFCEFAINFAKTFDLRYYINLDDQENAIVCSLTQKFD